MPGSVASGSPCICSVHQYQLISAGISVSEINNESAFFALLYISLDHASECQWTLHPEYQFCHFWRENGEERAQPPMGLFGTVQRTSYTQE